MDTISIIGLFSAVLGIIGFFFPLQWKNKIFIKIIFTSIFLLLSIFIIIQNSKINKIERISKSANLLIEKKSMEFSTEGFILASLSFLEQNKNDFPDSYERAKQIFKKYDESQYRGLESVNTASEMEGLIKGISIMSTVNEE